MAPHAVALVVYLLLTVALTWPLAIRLGEVVPHDLGDPLLSTAILWWNAQVVPFTARWWDGFFYFPGHSTLTLSDHRVGLGLIATPLIWTGASALTAHNVAFLASYVLSALAGYALAFTLTGRWLSAFIGGLVFGFNPFRAEHLPHLELLASFWLPVVLVALHQWTATRRGAWLVLLAVSLTLQAITCGYYFFFGGVLILLWLVWFLPRNATVIQYAGLGVALAAPLLLIAPVLLVYRAAHDEMVLARSIQEIEQYSADMLGLITPPEPLWLWNTPESWLRPEGAILTGVTGVVLVVAAVILGRRSLADGYTPHWLSITRVLFLLVAIGALLAVAVPPFYGPVGFDFGPLRISTSRAYKPLSVATVFFAIWVMTSPRMRDAVRRQSPFAFYALATVAMWLCALGPTARLLGERVLYKAPYSWLMLLPGFSDEFRVPARFAMLAAATLSAAAAIAFNKLGRTGQPRRPRTAPAWGTIVIAAVLLESWVAPFPLAVAPGPLAIPAVVPPAAAILELPTDFSQDFRAMYHATLHRRPIVNGASGYDPPHYAVVRAALRDKAVEVLPPLAAGGDIAIFVARESAAEWSPLLESRIAAQRIAATTSHDVLLLRRPPPAAPPPLRNSIALDVRGLASPLYPENLTRMLDDDRRTAWSSEASQKGGEEFTIDLGEVAEIHSVRMALGPHLTGFPRLLVIEVSEDGANWVEAWRGGTAAQAVTAALSDPRPAPLWFALQGRARFLRFRQLSQSENGWVVAELRVFGSMIDR